MPWWIIIPCVLLVAITFVAMLVYFVKGVVQIIRNWRILSFKSVLPTIIVTVTLAYTLLSPLRLDSEALESKVVLRACFEGTLNSAYILFREDNSFELNWIGVLFYDDWFYGTYKQKDDTLLLKYKTEKPYRFGDTLINNGQSLITINKFKVDSNQYFVPFYLGYCKGLN